MFKPIRLSIAVLTLTISALANPVIAQTTTTGSRGAGGGAALDLDLNIAPKQVIWGNVVNMTATASGGTPAYLYAFGITCKDKDVTAFAAVDSNQDGKGLFTYKATRTGEFKAAANVLDSTSAAKTKEDTFTVLAPDKIRCKTLTVTAQVTVTATTASAFGNVIFEVKRGNTNVGSWADGWAQERIAPPSINNPNKVGIFGNWAPARPTPLAGFNSSHPILMTSKGLSYLGQRGMLLLTMPSSPIPCGIKKYGSIIRIAKVRTKN